MFFADLTIIKKVNEGIGNMLQSGKILADRYEVVRPLGTGGMGSVYLAKDKRLSDSLRAIKKMIVETSNMEEHKKAVDDFRREAEVLANLDHPAIPSIYDYFIEEDYYYLVMKCVGGKDLEKILEESPTGFLSEKQVVKWAIQLCDVLQYIHSRKPPVIYRDMKPTNVMYDEEIDRIYLIDFGVARFVSSSHTSVTAVGTVGYAPPELFMGLVTPATDIYSLGATLIHLLVGYCPLSHPVYGFNFSVNPTPSRLNPSISLEIEQILLKATAQRARERYLSATEMKTALEEHLYKLDTASDKLTIKKFISPADLKAFLEIVYSNTLKTAKFVLNKEVAIIGRFDLNTGVMPEIDLAKYDNSGKVSRRHARIIWKSGKFYFEDLGSANGSLFNGEKVTPKQTYLLKTGDQFCVGETIIKYFQD